MSSSSNGGPRPRTSPSDSGINTAPPVPATTTSRTSMLDRLRGKPLPPVHRDPIELEKTTRFDDPVSVFVDTLSFCGGQAHFVESITDVGSKLAEIEVFRNASRIASTVPLAVKGNVSTESIDDPHALSTLDWSIVQGEFGVAENGAIWIDGANLPHRVMLFIAQYLAIVVSRSSIISNMHEGYARINKPTEPGFGVFVSGPSKTADIEQSLVLGAHGCRQVQVFLIP